MVVEVTLGSSRLGSRRSAEPLDGDAQRRDLLHRGGRHRDRSTRNQHLLDAERFAQILDGSFFDVLRAHQPGGAPLGELHRVEGRLK